MWNFKKSLAALKAAGLKDRELEIPHGPCYSFEAAGGQRFAIYELQRPQVNEFFRGRADS
ncbi:MAG: hypothetical protein HY369_03815 [Candidatus Aenigmarchaeota archaeon]|nr:hypothetical protein [Candidatus Aenigmarchaeota archaeon]